MEFGDVDRRLLIEAHFRAMVCEGSAWESLSRVVMKEKKGNDKSESSSMIFIFIFLIHSLITIRQYACKEL